MIQKYITMRIKTIWLCALCFLLPAGSGFATLIIEPANIKISLKQKSNSGTFILKNTSDTEERYRAKAMHFIITKKGGLHEIPVDEYSLAPWIKFNPQEFTLPAKSSRIIRYSIIPQQKLKPQEYWGAIEFEPLKGAKYTSQDTKGRTFNLEILSVVLVPIYGFVDGTKYSGAIKQVGVKKEKEKLTAQATVANTGNAILRLQGNYQIIDTAGTVIEEIPLKHIVIFPQTERIIDIDIKKALGPDKYTLKINLQSSDSRMDISLSRENQFSI